MIQTPETGNDTLLDRGAKPFVLDHLKISASTDLLDPKKHPPPIVSCRRRSRSPEGDRPRADLCHIFIVIAAMTVETLYLGTMSPVVRVAAVAAGTSAQSVKSRLSKR